MKFQNLSIHGSKVMLCTRKGDKRTNEWTSQKQYSTGHGWQDLGWGHKKLLLTLKGLLKQICSREHSTKTNFVIF